MIILPPKADIQRGHAAGTPETEVFYRSNLKWLQAVEGLIDRGQPKIFPAHDPKNRRLSFYDADTDTFHTYRFFGEWFPVPDGMCPACMEMLKETLIQLPISGPIQVWDVTKPVERDYEFEALQEMWDFHVLDE